MYIKPSYATFEQSKLFKEKGLISISDRYWVKMTITDTDNYEEISDIQLEDLDREISIADNLVVPKYQQWQIVEWLRINHGIWINCQFDSNFNRFYSEIYDIKNKLLIYFPGIEDDQTSYYKKSIPQEAYSAAFDYILNNKLI